MEPPRLSPEGKPPPIEDIDDEDVDRFIAQRTDMRESQLEPCHCDAAPYRHITARVPGVPVRTCFMVSRRTITMLRIRSGDD